LPFFFLTFIFSATTDFGIRKSAVIVRSKFSFALGPAAYSFFMLEHCAAMSRKLKRKKKKGKQKGPPTMLPQQYQASAAKPSKHGLFLTIVGLVLTTIGLVVALIELFPRLSAAVTPTTNLDDVLGSSKFTVTNDGYLKVIDVTSACFLWNVQMGKPPAGTAYFSSSLARIVQPPETNLVPTEGFTVPCTAEGRPIVGSSAPYIQPRIVRADLAIAVYYRAWPFTFYREHRLFRFVAHIGKEEVTWEKQPAAVLEPDFDKYIAEHGGTFPPQFMRPPIPH
jgi:hypothetical protein